jgi:uncharacterized protein (UPF0264 family)
VRNAEEASAALDGGADIIDAKEPDAGALGAVPLDTLRAIVRTVGASRPVTAAAGDAADEESVAHLAHAFVDAGARFVKIGLAGVDNPERATALLGSAARTAGAERIVAVAYADYPSTGGPTPEQVLRAAIQVGVAGILLDTADKRGPSLPGVVPLPALVDWVTGAREEGLMVALAGKLTADDAAAVMTTGADIIGVRGAACDGGRSGRLSADRVRWLRALVTRAAAGYASPTL